jgi:hypothetical protein
MTRKLEVGDTVICQFYNVPDKRFYGDIWKATIVEIQTGSPANYYPVRDFVVKDEEGKFHTVWRKEIKRRIK